nr:hypothetical protein [Fischerella sp. PCC 9605]
MTQLRDSAKPKKIELWEPGNLELIQKASIEPKVSGCYRRQYLFL